MPVTEESLASGFPDVESPVSVPGIDQEIEIFRDDFGIPHVKATSVKDAFFGQGFAAAQDRLWQMEHFRRWAYGRWAEYAGPEGLAQDRLLRRYQIAPIVKNDYQRLGDAARSMVDAYAAGVNAFIGSTDKLPIEYEIVGGTPEPWEPRDCLAVYKVRHVLMGKVSSKLTRARMVNMFGVEIVAEILKSQPTGGDVTMSPGTKFSETEIEALDDLTRGAEAINWMGEEQFGGSNNWVLSGTRTESGKPLVSGESHRPLGIPNVYYQSHIACPDFDVIGFAFPGFPGFPHYGHNAHVAWCVTNGEADIQDLFIERFKAGEPSKYEYQGEWQEAEVRRERIDVRGGQSEYIDAVITRHGPIIAGSPESGHAIAFKYPANTERDTSAECILEMMTAGSASELHESMRTWVDPTQNFIFADVAGNIGYLNRSKVPIRSRANTWLPVPGWTGEHEWQGYIPFDELPALSNPEAGYVATANNRVVDDDYPYYFSNDYAPDYRVRRVIARILELGKATVEDMEGIHSEGTSIPAQVFNELLADVKPDVPLTRRALEKLLAWDCVMDRDAVEPTIYSAFRLKLNTAVVEELLCTRADKERELTDELLDTLVSQVSTSLVNMAASGDTSLLPAGDSWNSVLTSAFENGVEYLRQRLGDDINTWTWGTVHHTSVAHTLSPSFPDLAHLLDPPSVAMGGDGETPRSGGYNPSEPFVITGIDVTRYVFDLSDWEKSTWLVPFGSSGHPGNPHYADQVPLWTRYESLPMKYAWDGIRRSARTSQVISPDSP